MSRTRKDRPLRVRVANAARTVERHFSGCETRGETYRGREYQLAVGPYQWMDGPVYRHECDALGGSTVYATSELLWGHNVRNHEISGGCNSRVMLWGDDPAGFWIPVAPSYGVYGATLIDELVEVDLPTVPCDIDGFQGGGRCHRWADGFDAPQCGTPKDVRRAYWTRPERAAVRLALQDARREANSVRSRPYEGSPEDESDGLLDWDDFLTYVHQPWIDVDADGRIPTGQHHHSMFKGGYWD